MGAPQAEDEGLEPTKEWVKDLIDEIIAEEFASPDLELIWLDEDTDAATAQAQLESRVKLGALTLNELRDALGLDPFDVAAADRQMVLTPTGYVPIEAGAGTQKLNGSRDEANRQGADVQAVPPTEKSSLVKAYNPDEPRVPAGSPQGGQWTTEEGVGSSVDDAGESVDDNGETANIVDDPSLPTSDSQVAQALPPSLLFEEPPLFVRPPFPEYPDDPTVSPGPGFEWFGRPGSQPGDPEGSWYNPNTGETLRPDTDHPPPIGPHWDYRAPNKQWYRWFPDGRFEIKS